MTSSRNSFAHRLSLLAIGCILPGLVLTGMASSPSSAAPALDTVAQPRVGVASSNGSWSALGSGMGGIVWAMAKSDDTLYLGGSFTSAGGAAANYVAAWSPSDGAYSTLDSGVNDYVWALAVGADDSVYIGGEFTANGGSFTTNYYRLAKWDPGARVMSTVGPGVSSRVKGLAIRDDTLYIGGSFIQKEGGGDLPRIAQWGPLSGVSPALSKVGVGVGNNTVEAVHVPRDGGNLYLGGDFSQKVNGSFMDLPKFAKFGPLANSPVLSTVGPGISNGVVLSVNSTRDDTVFLGGSFTPAGITTLRRVGAWNPGSGTYSNLGYGLDGTDGVFSIAVDDTHSLVYVGGAITYACGPLANCPSTDDTVPLNGIGAFDLRTQDWVPLVANGGSGLNADAYALVLDDSTLYAGGNFTSSSGGTSLSRVAKWTWAPPSGNATILHSGSNSIVVPGQSFVGVTGVTIGGSPAAIDYGQSSSTQLAVTVPGLSTGNHPIVVTAVGGTATVGTYSIPVPSAPVVTASAGQTSVDLSWTLDDSGGSAVTYLVALGTTSNIVNTTTNTTTTLTGLNPGTTYTVYVRANNNNGLGPWSTPTTFTTQSTSPTPAPPAPAPASPPGAPTSISAIPGNASAVVSWTPPTDSGTYPIASYVVRSQPDGLNCSTTSTSCTVTGLTNGTAYTFTVTASSPAGAGPASAASAPVTPRTVPGAPVSVAATPGIDQATISWSPPTDDGGSAITGYRVTTVPASRGCQTLATTCTLTDLDAGQEYVVTVVAVNATGESAPSQPVTVTPRERPVILITGARGGKADALVRVKGEIRGLEVRTVQPHYRLAKQRAFRSAASPVPVTDGSFTWQRATSKKMTVYVEAGDLRSNTVSVPAR